MPLWWSHPTSKHAYYLAAIGVVLEFICAVAGIAGWLWLGSALCLVYGLENFVDFLSSAVAFWRFYCPGELTPEREQLLSEREARAGVAISFIIFLLGVTVIIAAVGDLEEGQPEEGDASVDEGLIFVMWVAGISVILFSGLTILKFHYGKRLNSETLSKDGLCSLIGMALSIAIFVNNWIIARYPQYWQLDATFAVGCGIIAMIIGTHGMIDAVAFKGMPIYRLSWWRGTDNNKVDADPTKDTNLSEVV